MYCWLEGGYSLYVKIFLSFILKRCFLLVCTFGRSGRGVKKIILNLFFLKAVCSLKGKRRTVNTQDIDDLFRTVCKHFWRLYFIWGRHFLNLKIWGNSNSRFLSRPLTSRLLLKKIKAMQEKIKFLIMPLPVIRIFLRKGFVIAENLLGVILFFKKGIYFLFVIILFLFQCSKGLFLAVNFGEFLEWCQTNLINNEN